MSDVKQLYFNGFLSSYVAKADYDALRAELEAERENARDWLVEHCALQAERDQLRAEADQFRELAKANGEALGKALGELESIRGQEPVAWVSPDAVGGTRWKAGALQQLNDGSPLYALPPQQPDAVSVIMSDAELDALWREIQDAAMREPGLPHIRFAHAILSAKVDNAVSVPREVLESLLGAEAESLHGQYEAAMDKLRALLTTKTDGVV